MIETILNWLWDALVDYRRVRVGVHLAYFTKSEPRVWAYFVNIVNQSRNREIEVTHVWFDCDPIVPAMPPERQLPKRLKTDEVWETWVEFEKLPDWIHEQPHTYCRVRLSTGRVIKAKASKNVPSRGTVPGGPITSYPDE